MSSVLQSEYFRKALTIAEDLRGQIVSGELSAGDRLPTRTELSASYGVSNVTVQRALDRLREDGFVVTEGRRGTFVAPAPPHLSRYALLFPKPRGKGHPFNLYWEALDRCAREVDGGDGGDVSVVIHGGFEGREGFINYDELMEDLRTHRVAGLIFANPPVTLEGTPLLTEPGIPRTMFSASGTPQMPAVAMDGKAFARRALNHLYSEGSRSPAVLMTAAMPSAIAENYQAQAGEMGMRMLDHWCQSAIIHDPGWTERLMRLMFHPGQPELPDSLVICDDNLIQAATRTLRDMGVSLPIVALCNYPVLPEASLPVTRLGYDQREALRRAIANIDDLRAGRTPSPVTVIPPMFEHEVPPVPKAQPPVPSDASRRVSRGATPKVAK